MSGCRDNDHLVIWLNGRLLPIQEAGISPLDRGFLYGDGLFETMRAEGGVVLYLPDHLRRIKMSAAALRINWDDSLDWPAIFKQLLLLNQFPQDVAVAKIILTRGVAPGMGLPEAGQTTLCVTVQRYRGPDESSYIAGWRLNVFRQGYTPPLARHKTLNYLYYLMARQHAVDAGYDEAIILDDQGMVAETAAGSLLIKTGGMWWRPACNYQLYGTTVARVIELLRENGDLVSERDQEPGDLADAETIWVCNSLLGIMPVCELEGRPLSSPLVEQAARLRVALFERGRTFSHSAGEPFRE